MTQAVSRQSVTAKARNLYRFSPCDICDLSGTGRCFSGAYQFLPLTFTPLITHRHRHLNGIHVLKENQRILGIFKQTNAVSDIAGTLERKVILLLFFKVLICHGMNYEYSD
jgi:hypothetical protein